MFVRFLLFKHITQITIIYSFDLINVSVAYDKTDDKTVSVDQAL